MSSSQSESRTTPNPTTWVYDVFLSFRGEDVRRTFISHLHSALRGIHVFMDDEGLQRGDEIAPSLIRAIETSRISLIVLSKNYGNSRWCLQELEKIMDCRRTIGQITIPIFYNVEPSDVRHQKGEFGDAFQYLVERRNLKDKAQVWRKLLSDVANISGLNLGHSGYESQFVEKVVDEINTKLDVETLFVAQHPVGVEPRVQHLIKWLNYEQTNDVILLGILGIGGIGKTTIAKAIYNKINRDFEGRCFLPNIRELWEQNTNRASLQERILSDIYKTTKLRIHDIESGQVILRDRLRHRRVLLILDDVDKSEQLEALCGSHQWFGPGSRVIITTRDEHLLKVHKVDRISRMSEMDHDESIEHFSWHAFKQSSPEEEFLEICWNVVEYCRGLPLALEVIGAFLFDRDLNEWQNVVEKLKRIPNNQVQKKLRISFDGLNDDAEKEIFLDIAFFFIGMDRNDVVHILDEYDAKIGISVLIDRCLVTVDNNNKLGMHDLLRDMGREIIREKSPNRPEERSILWLQKEVLNVLSKNMGTKSVEGLTLKLPRMKSICLETKAFKEMKRLRLLQLDNVQLGGNFEDLSKDIRWLYWRGFPLKYMPPNFYQESLVAIELESSNLRSVWKEAQLLENLKVLNLNHSHHLTQTPDFSYLPNLEKLLLKDCQSLSSISNTIENLKKILLIDLEDCTSLRKLPRSFYKLKSLKILKISGCVMIDKLEEDIEQMESLVTLIADKTGITQVPFSIVRSQSIGYISLCGHEGFSRDVFPSLIWSWMSPTNNPSSLSFRGSEIVPLDVPKLGSFWVECDSELQLNGVVTRTLATLYATYKKELEATPTTSQVSNMRSSALVSFQSYFHISGLLKSVLIEVGMQSQATNSLRERILQKFTTGCDDSLLPGDNENWWLAFDSKGSSVIFTVPHMNGCNLKTMMLCIVYSSTSDTITSECPKNVLIINYTKSTIQLYKRDKLACLEDEEWQKVISDLEPGNRVEVLAVGFGDEFTVKKTTVYLVYDELIDQYMEHSNHVDVVSGANYIAFGSDHIAIEKDFSVSSDDDIAIEKDFSDDDDVANKKCLLVMISMICCKEQDFRDGGNIRKSHKGGRKKNPTVG